MTLWGLAAALYLLPLGVIGAALFYLGHVSPFLPHSFWITISQHINSLVDTLTQIPTSQEYQLKHTSGSEECELGDPAPIRERMFSFTQLLLKAAVVWDQYSSLA